MKLKERLWIWGQDAGSHDDYDLPGHNTIGPIEGAKILGIPNCCRVVMHGNPEPPFDAETARLAASFDRIVWSGIGDSGSTRNDGGGDDVAEVIRQAKLCSKVKGCVFDDFFKADGPRITHARMKQIVDMLHEAGLFLWLVSYDLTLPGLLEYKDYFDGITLWTWSGKDLAILDERLLKLRKMLRKEQQAIAGCYLWDYGTKAPLTKEMMAHQCDVFAKRLADRTISDVIVCSNCVLGVGIDSEKYMAEWIARNGETEI